LIDPASAIGLGTGAGSVVGLVLRFITQAGQNKLDAIREGNRHAETLNKDAQDYRKSLQDDANLDKGEPYSRKVKLWKFNFEWSGTKPDRLVPPPHSFELRMLVLSYCWAIFVCFLCPDLVVFSRDIEGSSSSWSFVYGIIERTSPDKAVYIQTLSGIGSALLTTASFVITSTIVGFARQRS